MRVQELIAQLEKFDPTTEVCVSVLNRTCFNNELRSITLQPMPHNHLKKQVVLQDHFSVRNPKIVKLFDGREYEVPWP